MKYRILSLDGGGSWALIQARVLQDIYGDIRGHELLKKFDMAIANSGGSLALACLCNDMKLSEIIAVFEDANQRKEVFSRLTFLEKFKWRNIASLITRKLGPRYSAERKVKGLVKVLTEKDHLLKEGKISKPIVETYLNELPAIIGKNSLQIIIAGFDYFKERVSFFRSNATSNTDSFGNGKFFRVSLAHAIHSSSNAPVNYFDEPAHIDISLLSDTKKDDRTTKYWDGAVAGFNNPVLAGLVEAVTNNSLSMNDYCVLSIGTGTGSLAILTEYKSSTDPEMQNIYEANKNNPLAITDTSSGFAKDVKKMATSILGDPPDSATFIAYSFLDPTLSNKANLVRINPCYSPVKNKDTNKYEAPSIYNNYKKEYEALLGLDMDAVEDAQVGLISDLCNKFIVTNGSDSLPNQFVRGDKAGKHLGYSTYKEAKDKWTNDCM